MDVRIFVLCPCDKFMRGGREEKRGRDTLKGAKREIVNVVRKKGGEMTMLGKA